MHRFKKTFAILIALPVLSALALAFAPESEARYVTSLRYMNGAPVAYCKQATLSSTACYSDAAAAKLKPIWGYSKCAGYTTYLEAQFDARSRVASDPDHLTYVSVVWPGIYYACSTRSYVNFLV